MGRVCQHHRRRRRVIAQPHVLPDPVPAAPQRLALPVVLAGSLGDQAEPVDRGLDGHLALAQHAPDLLRERVEPASLRDRLYQLYGEREDLLEVHKSAGGITMIGFVAALAEQVLKGVKVSLKSSESLNAMP